MTFNRFRFQILSLKYGVCSVSVSFGIALFAGLVFGFCNQLSGSESQEVVGHAEARNTGQVVVPHSIRDYTFGYWLNGMRKHQDDSSPDVLCFETGHYGFSLDLSDFRKAHFGRFDEAKDYLEALGAGASRMDSLEPTELLIELESKGTVFRAISCEAGTAPKRRLTSQAWLWESGRYAQHFELKRLDFKDRHGRTLGVAGSLALVAWPDSLSLTVELAPCLNLTDGWQRGVVGNGLGISEKPWSVPHEARLESPELSVECWILIPENHESPAYSTLLSKNGHEGTPGHYSFSMRHGRLSANMHLGGGADGRISIPQRGAYKFGTWNHLVLTSDEKSVCFYLNGVLQGSRTVERSRVSGNGPLSLGKSVHKRVPVAKAVYDQVRVWGRALSPESVRAHAAKPEAPVEKTGLLLDETFDRYGAPEVAETVWSDVIMRMRLPGAGGGWEAERKIDGTWAVGKKERLSLHCGIGEDAAERKALSVQVTTGGDSSYPVRFDPKYNCQVAEVRKISRNWTLSSGNDIRDYDEFEIVVENPGDGLVSAPFLLDLYPVASITGVCPVLCDVNGVPTGVPVQLSKNWHYSKTGQYLRAFTQLPAPPGRSEYKLRIAYGFYGTLPSATHAQLSLVGYGGHGRWDQLAIGCWGETICFDVDMSLTDVAITDVRMLMTRNGHEGKKWTWTDAGWGGDWLNVQDASGQKLLFSEMKTAYLSQGPCLTDTRYDRNYGSGGEVSLQARVQTLRTDDFARTFQTLHYTFNKELSASGSWLFKMGRTGNSVSPRIAHGNGEGLVLDEPVPSTLRDGDIYQDRVQLEGEAPWWVGFPGGFLTGQRAQGWGTGSRGWVIRSYRASFGGREYTAPSFTMPVYRTSGEGVNLDLLLAPPSGVEKFLPGDSVEMEVEWITFPRRAQDYYGPNDSFRKHLQEHPESWRTIHREATGNDLEVAVEGGTLVNAYPLAVRAEKPEVRVRIEGGCGAVPIRFEGLQAATGHQLFQVIDGEARAFDQAVHGNDFWQTDYDPAGGCHSITFNLPLDDAETTEWLLRSRPGNTPGL